MDCTCSHLPYRQTGFFTRIINDYLERDPALKPFYEHEVSLEGIRQSITNRRKFANHREVLTKYLDAQYDAHAHPAVKKNIGLLSLPDTFTICTAHQPAIFTGTLYFIYKILHAIKLARELCTAIPGSNFIPVYYMGSEDADLDELGNIHLNGEKITWDTKQTGSVGRMKPAGLDKIINRIEGELGVEPYGKELILLIRKHYLHAPSIQAATFSLLNELFGEFGLIVLVPDAPALKQLMIPVFEDDLFRQVPSSIVEKTASALSAYKVQANPREINLFYLDDGTRNRIVQQGNKWMVMNQSITFTEDALKNELQAHPEKFSPNVILRGLFQETILPNIVFIGGGGEMAYWLEFKELFHHYGVPYPVLLLRNSFLVIESKWKAKIDQLGLDELNLFNAEVDLMTLLVNKESSLQLSLAEEINKVNGYYDHIKQVATTVDRSLEQHVSALQAKALKPIRSLEKKMVRAEKRKFQSHQQQVQALKSALFPLNNLQERIENFMPFYARYGPEFLRLLLQHSLTLEQEFTVLTVIP